MSATPKAPMDASAALTQVLPRALSFAGAKRFLASFCHQFVGCKSGNIPSLIEVLLTRITKLKLQVRPGRIEPRAKKRRPKNLPLLTMPRHVARQVIRIKQALILVP